MDRKGLIFISCFSAMLFFVNLYFDRPFVSSPNQAHAGTQKEQSADEADPHRPLDPKQALKVNALHEQQSDLCIALENDSLQLIISLREGNIREINLPLKSPSHPQSVIQSTEFDHLIAEQCAENAQFPLSANGGVTICNQAGQTQPLLPRQGGYYPLLRRKLEEQPRSTNGAMYPFPAAACSVLDGQRALAATEYRVVHLSRDRAVLQARNETRRITTTYSLSQEPTAAPYCFRVDVKLEGAASDLWLSSGVPEVELLSGAAASMVKYQALKGAATQVVKMDLPAQVCTVAAIRPEWLANSNGFFALIAQSLTSKVGGLMIERVDGRLLPSRLCYIDASWQRFPPKSFPGYQTLQPLNPKLGHCEFQYFTGPLAQNVLKQVDHQLQAERGGANPDFASCQSFHGWFAFISQPFAKLLMILMRIFYSVTGSWALSICLLTLALRLMLYPLNTWSMTSTKRMREIAPRMREIQETHKKEPQRAQKEILKLYRANNINPLSGCLPLLLQMPFLIGMFDLLKSSFELRGATFIPGWIDDLSAPDVLTTLPTPLPFFGHQVHLLPVLVGLAMYWQQKISAPVAPSSGEMSEQQKQQKAVGNVMTLAFTAMFYHFPSGLNLYWLSSILLGAGQQWWLQRQPAARASGEKSTLD